MLRNQVERASQAVLALTLLASVAGSLAIRPELAAAASHPAPALSVVATAGNASDGEIEYIDGVRTVDFDYLITNLGNTYLVDIALVDDAGTPGETSDDKSVCTIEGPLEPGDTASCSTQFWITRDATHLATASAEATSGDASPIPGVTNASDSDDAVVDRVSPAVSIALTVDESVINPGDTVTFTYQVTNVGDTHLDDLIVRDDNGTPEEPFDDAYVCSIAGPIAPSATSSCSSLSSLHQDITQTGGIDANPVLASGVGIPDISGVSAASSASVDVIYPDLTVRVTTPHNTIEHGASARFSYSVANTGDSPVSAVGVNDTVCAPVSYNSEANGNGDAALDPGEVWTFGCSETFTQDITTDATATGVDLLDQVVSFNAENASVNVINPDIDIWTSAGFVRTVPGTTITYTHTVTNSGDAPLTDVTVNANQLGGATFTSETTGNGDSVLDPGEVWKFGGSVTAPNDDLTGTATVAGSNAAGSLVQRSDSITIIISNPPVAADDSASTNQDLPVTIDVLAGDVDPDSNIDPTSVSLVSQPARGSTAINPATGHITYTPNPRSSGVDRFEYEVCDDKGFCDIGRVSVSVNKAPKLVDDLVIAVQDRPVVIAVLGNDSDSDGIDTTSLAIGSPPSNGRATADPANGTIGYAPNPGFVGSDTFSYLVCDSLRACGTASVLVSINGLPHLVTDSAWTPQDTPVVIDVLANDSDPGGRLDPASLREARAPLNGSIEVDSDGAITYKPSLGFYGRDSFRYRVCDGLDQCAESYVTVVVDGAPAPLDDAVQLNRRGPVVVRVLANDTDPDSPIDPQSVAIIDRPSRGTATVDKSTGDVTYTPNSSISRTDSFTYEVCDTDGVCSTARVLINPTLLKVSGRVFLDSNRNGVSDRDEVGIDAVVVNLYAPGPDGQLLTGDDALYATTRAAGSFEFTNVLPGPYALVLDPNSLPSGLYASDDLDLGSDRVILIQAAKTDLVGHNFGEATSMVRGVLTDDVGQPVSGVEVVLTDSAGNSFTAISRNSGSYEFVGIMGSQPLAEGSATLLAVVGNRTATINFTVGAGTVVEQNLNTSPPEALPFSDRPANSSSPLLPILLSVAVTFGAALVLRLRRVS